MNRRSFLTGIGVTAGLALSSASGSRAKLQVPERSLWETSEERFLNALSLIPDTDRFRSLLNTDLRWVDVGRQADAWGTEFSDALVGGYWPTFGEFRHVLTRQGIGVDQVLSVESKSSTRQTDRLGVWTGADSDILIEKLRSLDFEETDYGDITMLVQRNVDLQRVFLDATQRYHAVLKNENVLVIASSYELILEYCAFMNSLQPRLDASVDTHTLALLREESWTQQWMPGEVLHKSQAEFPPPNSKLSSRSEEIIRGLEHLEHQEFGVVPRVVRFSLGQDAGFQMASIRNPEEPPRPLADGYGSDPRPFIRLQYETESDALLACDIIEWRWKYALSWSSGEVLSGVHSPDEIDRSEIAHGVITQEFLNRSDWFLRETAYRGDLSIYGWGSL